MRTVAAAAVADLKTAFDLLTGKTPVPVVPGLTDAEVRLAMVTEVVAGVGTTLAAALDVTARAEAMLASMVNPVALSATEPVEVEPSEDEDREPFGFAAYHWRKERAAKAA